ncbi:hypothetical protein FGIG_06582 [Fasciola gigantica]|uniref:Protein transport protein Sec31A n=1 Tax=Fasciola gigantica TaxID=46835 RepID=A0A504YKL7_FASGI|nr:hypothetical protein FGIG_06582 [Fasciola gigantica]
MKPNSYMPPELQPSMSTGTPPVPVPYSGHNAPNFGYPPTMTNPTQLASSPVVRPPTGFDQTWTPGTMIPSVVSPPGLISNFVPSIANSVMPSTGGRSLVGSHTGSQLSSAEPNPCQPNPVLPPVLSAASQTFPDGNASLPPPRTATSGAWNDPPFLANTYKAPGVLRPPSGQSAHLMNGSQSQPHPLVPPLLPSQRPQPRLDASQWPAAQPLASPTLALNANSESAPADLDETLPGSNDAEPITNMHPVTAEYEAVEATLRKLVQLCEIVVGKPYASKMDTVDRRLQSLFTALRGGTGAHLMSDQVVHHLLDCVRSADCGDYGAAVDHANLLIQSAIGFESIHGFAPGLKILMQSAKQLFPNQSTSPDDHLRPKQPPWPPTSMVTGMR